MVDTHCHLNMMVDKKSDALLTEEQLKEIGVIVAAAGNAGVQTILNVGTSLNESRNCVTIAGRYPNVYSSVGIHPCDCSSSWRKQMAELRLLVKDAEKNRIVAIGETGLDFYHKPYDQGLQTDVFKTHIELALENDLPLVVHVREAADEVLRVLEEFKGEARGTFHCFQQKQYVADQAIEWGWLLGIDAPITYPKGEQLRSVVAAVGLEHLILETDAPFLPPQSRRGKQNSPVYMIETAEKVAEVKGVSVEEVIRVTDENVKRIFSI